MRFPTIDAETFTRELASPRPPIVLDVRPREAFEAGHVPGASNVPVHEMARRVDELPRSRVARIVVIGDPGPRSAAAATWLALVGYVDVALLDGGFAAWSGAVETGPPAPPAPRWQPELRVLPNES